ncbi:MAG: 16S rRNA (cytidine(1402)-2'-O)-methyltransferase [Acutalibacteraceae bacterium]|nr:16S rRNA (cytidine(1402)-2'-O)-methyltransferase [Acutalibacteraceae bacterium]
MAGKLYVVGTPIGNLSDFSPRAIETLGKVDFIAAEDTRVTVKLLNHFGINKPMLAYYEHNKMERGGDIMARLLSGEECALVSDAGMPAISDPGEDLVRMAHENGIPVESVPGPSALITALAISGMKSGRFCFEGFLSVNKPSRRAHLAELKGETRTMIFYEAPHKLPATLSDMLETFGDRKITLVRELTKLHEEVIRTTLSEAINLYSDQNKPRGEFVLIVEGQDPQAERQEYTLEQAVALAQRFMEQGSSASAAAKAAALDSGLKKGDIYKKLISN